MACKHGRGRLSAASTGHSDLASPSLLVTVRPQFCHHAMWPRGDIATKTLTFSDSFSSFKTSIHPYESKLLWKYFRCKTIPECVLFTDSCMNVRLVLLWLFCLRWHGCTFPSYYSVKTVCLKKTKNKIKKRLWPGFVKVLGKITIDCFRNHD